MPRGSRQHARRTPPHRWIGITRIFGRHRIVRVEPCNRLSLAVRNLQRHHTRHFRTEVVVNHRPIRRIPGRRKIRRPRRRRIHAIPNPSRRLRSIQVRVFFSCGCRNLSQRRHVIQNQIPATMRRRNQVVALHLEIANRTRRHIQPQRLPVIAVVERDIHLRLRSRIQQPLAFRIFANRAGRPAIREFRC